MEKIIELQEQIIDNNYELLRLLNSLSPADYNYYLPLVKNIICKPSPTTPPLTTYGS